MEICLQCICAHYGALNLKEDGFCRSSDFVFHFVRTNIRESIFSTSL